MPEQFLEHTAESTSRLVAPEAGLGYSRLYLDFLAGADPAAGFFLAKSAAEVANCLDQVKYDRDKLCGILRRQNSAYNASAATFASIDKLHDSRALCIFAGQQAGLFGGPLLTLLKALSVVKMAAIYSEQLERPVIPMFWIAGDDHDFEEANHTFVLCRRGEINRIAYETPPAHPLPIAEVTFADPEELDRAKTLLKECLGQTDFTNDLLALIDRSYTSKDTLVTAFGKFMAGLTDGLGLVLFSPGDQEVKHHAVPFFRTILEKQEEIRDLLLATNQRIEQAGYHIQVEKKDDAAHLFYNHEERRPVRHDNGRLVAGDETFTEEMFLRKLTDHAERFSPDVLLRPVFQSYLFPTVSQKAGPAEIAYLAQLNHLFALFDLPASLHRARPSATIVETRMEKHLAEYDIAFEDLTGDVEQIINRILTGTFPTDLEKDFNALHQAIEGRFAGFRDEALDFDRSLKETARQTWAKIDFTLKAFEGKVFSAHKKKSQQTRDRIYRLANALYPRHGLQERTLNISYFLSRYGFDLVDFLYERIDSEQTAHQLISMTEYPT